MSNTMAQDFDCDVAIIGAGPSGAVAAALMRKKGYSVIVLERQKFPRFSIGESLLPQCMAFIKEAGLLKTLEAQGFQYKDGAAFHYNGQTSDFDFSQKSATGRSDTFQVIRSEFDTALIEETVKMGVDLRYETSVTGGDFTNDHAILDVSSNDKQYQIKSRFCLDASGYGRVLPRLLDLDAPSNFPNRASYFTHIEDNIDDPAYNRNRILITVHPDHKDIWFWLIPFSNGTASIGIVGDNKYFTEMSKAGKSHEEILKTYIAQDKQLTSLLTNAVFKDTVRAVEGYSCSVKSLYGPSYALLGNAGEFLDPVFSSGITIAMKSASLAANALDRQFKGEDVSWQKEFSDPLMVGVQTFRAFVEAWYEGKLIDIFFTKQPHNDLVRRYLTSILAGYAWDEDNPYVKHPARRLNSLHEVCK